jgi:histidine triad (HIT) family protein
MGAVMTERLPFDLERYVRERAQGPCFICAMLRGEPGYHHHRIAEDEDTVLFLSKFPTQPGYGLVCPKRHVEDLAEDLSPEASLGLQARVHRLARALKQVFDAERIYVLSLGSQRGNSHLHFHVVPLPRGVPYAQQQYHALMAEHGVLRMEEAELAAMAATIGKVYAAL